MPWIAQKMALLIGNGLTGIMSRRVRSIARVSGSGARLMAVFACLAGVWMPLAASGQQALDEAAEQQRRLVQELERVQASQGPLSADLIEPLTALVLFYEENGDEVPAIAASERALQIVRANYGLYSLEQVPWISRFIERAEAIGDTLTAWNLEQELITVVRRNPDNLRTVPILREIADGRVEMLDRFIAGEQMPQIIYGCYYSPPGLESTRGCTAGSQRVAAAAILNEAHARYFDAIRILRNHDLVSGEEIREIEMDIVRSTFMHGKYLISRDNCIDVDASLEGSKPSADGSDLCQPGVRGLDRRHPCIRVQESLDRIYEYDVLSNAPLSVRAESLVQSADFRLFCEWNSEALTTYRQALDLLQAEGAPQSMIERFFSPPAPIDLPTFADSPLDTEPAGESAPYIDVRFALSRFGTTRSLKVLDGDKRVAADVLNRIRRGRFRPVVHDGEFVSSDPFVVRYYLNN